MCLTAPTGIGAVGTHIVVPLWVVPDMLAGSTGPATGLGLVVVGGSGVRVGVRRLQVWRGELSGSLCSPE